MKLTHTSLYFLPVLFIANIFVTQPWLEYVLLDYGYGERVGDYRILMFIIVINALILHFWLLALASGKPGCKPWKAVLSLNLGIILPGSLAFILSLIVISKLQINGDQFRYAFFSAAIFFLSLFWPCYKLLCSRLFFPCIGERFDYWHIWFLIISGVEIYWLNALFFYTVVYSF